MQVISRYIAEWCSHTLTFSYYIILWTTSIVNYSRVSVILTYAIAAHAPQWSHIPSAQIELSKIFTYLDTMWWNKVQLTNIPLYCQIIIHFLRIFCVPTYIAAQMWLLGRILPIIIGDLVPEGDHYWENYLIMMRIVDILFSPRTTEDLIGYLSQKIYLHHSQFKASYLNDSIISKITFECNIHFKLIIWSFYLTVR